MELKEKLKELISSYEGGKPLELLEQAKEVIDELHREKYTEISKDFHEIGGLIPKQVKYKDSDTIYTYLSQGDIYANLVVSEEIGDDYTSYSHSAQTLPFTYWVLNNLDELGSGTWQSVGTDKVERRILGKNKEEEIDPTIFKLLNVCDDDGVPEIKDKRETIKDYYDNKLDNKNLFTAELESMRRYMYTMHKEVINRLRNFEQYFKPLV